MDSDSQHTCTCCGRTMARKKLHALGPEPTYICRRCGLWVAFRFRSDRPASG
ncbi:MAG: hypothetical protein JWQ75_1242 [Pseudarthrobacter sp.]|nr:hypothetical protein [Pseudarthrobacter sp.]